MSRKRLAMLLSFSLAINVAFIGTVAWHHVVPHRAASPHHPHHSSFREALELTDAQVEAFAGLRAEFDTRRGEAHRRLIELRRQLEAELAASEPNRDKIDELLATSARVQAECQQDFVEMMYGMRDRLEPSQLGRFREILNHHLLSKSPHHAGRPHSSHRSH